MYDTSKDWADLWRPELAGKISMVDSPREVVGVVLKCMGASYNTNNIDSQVAGGRNAVQQKLALLAKQHDINVFESSQKQSLSYSYNIDSSKSTSSSPAASPLLLYGTNVSLWKSQAEAFLLKRERGREVREVRLFDTLHYLKAFGVGDVWVAVGWSSDVIPAAKRMSNVAVIAPKSGSSLWADLWVLSALRIRTLLKSKPHFRLEFCDKITILGAGLGVSPPTVIPAASRFATDQIGGRFRGPSPLVHQWIEFCMQAERAHPFKENVIPGALPFALENGPAEELEALSKGKPKLDTNLIAGAPPAEILARCEFLDPLSDAALSDYKWLIASIKKPSGGLIQRVQHYISSVLSHIFAKVAVKGSVK
ncbi:unnamed protein product [Ilex paraguariensis]|uniref:Uncharacterized protein n=1 Tax=Ilex paraguariensis TaxID=185542 RepID=A0ABC8UD51_9AQUA